MIVRLRTALPILHKCANRMHLESAINYEVKEPPKYRILITKSAPRKSRIRRNAEGRLSTTSSFQKASSHPLESELQAELSNRLYVPGRDDSQEVDQPDKLWGAGRISNASDSQTSPQRQAQREQDGSSLPEFDADSALAMTRKVCFHWSTESWLWLTRDRSSDLNSHRVSKTERPSPFQVEDAAIPAAQAARTRCPHHSSQLLTSLELTYQHTKFATSSWKLISLLSIGSLW
jgi:hypothetical protein